MFAISLASQMASEAVVSTPWWVSRGIAPQRSQQAGRSASPCRPGPGPPDREAPAPGGAPPRRRRRRSSPAAPPARRTRAPSPGRRGRCSGRSAPPAPPRAPRGGAPYCASSARATCWCRRMRRGAMISSYSVWRKKACAKRKRTAPRPRAPPARRCARPPRGAATELLLGQAGDRLQHRRGRSRGRSPRRWPAPGCVFALSRDRRLPMTSRRPSGMPASGSCRSAGT